MPRFTILSAVLSAMSFAAPAVAQPSDEEHLTLVGAANEVIAVVDGDRSGVAIDAGIDGLLLRPGANITMVHNHPNGMGLSMPDLLQLAKAGVKAIVANGADGSRYEAARGTSYDADRFEAAQYRAAHDQVVKALLFARAHEPALPTFDGQIAHLATIALQRANVLEYHATLAGTRAVEWSAHRMLLASVSEAAAARVRELRAPVVAAGR